MIIVANKKRKLEKIKEEQYEGKILSPFYPHGRIPISMFLKMFLL